MDSASTEYLQIRPMQSHQADDVKRVIMTVVCELFAGDSSQARVEKALRSYETQGLLTDIENSQTHYFDRNGTFLVLLDGERVVGMGGIRPLDESIAELKRMWFLPEYRGRGLGRRLAEELLQFARSAGYTYVRLDTARNQPQALRLYQRLGFHEIPRYNDSSCDVFMELDLTLEGR
jgi:putative acetyltransferase